MHCVARRGGWGATSASWRAAQAARAASSSAQLTGAACAPRQRSAARALQAGKWRRSGPGQGAGSLAGLVQDASLDTVLTRLPPLSPRAAAGHAPRCCVQAHGLQPPARRFAGSFPQADQAAHLGRGRAQARRQLRR